MRLAVSRDQLRGEARDGVRLMHAGGDAELRAHLERGEAGVAASTDDDVGPEVLQDALRLLANVADMRCTVTRLCQMAAGVSFRW